MASKDTIFQQVVNMVVNAHQLHYDMTKNMQMHDLTPLQYEILELLVVEQPMMVSQISECKGISMPNMSREIRKLTEKGFCEKVEDTSDRRKQYITLTKLGEERMAEAFGHMQQQFLQRLSYCSESELMKISEALETLEMTLFRAK